MKTACRKILSPHSESQGRANDDSRCKTIIAKYGGGCQPKYLDKQPTKNDSQRNAGCLFGHKMGTARETHSQSRISMSRPQQKGMTSPFLT